MHGKPDDVAIAHSVAHQRVRVHSYRWPDAVVMTPPDHTFGA